MKPVWLFSFFIAGMLAGCEPSKYLHYQELDNQVTGDRPSSILIVGTGTSGTNLFLESLSSELNDRLKDKNITTVYHHLGSNQKEANNLFREIIKANKYDAVLQFSQLDETKNPIVILSSPNDINVGYGRYWPGDASRAIRFEQKFVMRYFTFTDLSNSMLDASVGVKMDFINPRDYVKLTEYVMKSLRLK